MSKITSAYIAADHVGVRKSLAKRTIDNQIPYIQPYLAEMPDEFTFLDVGCGPGSLTIEIASRYPKATVVGIDGSEDSVADATRAAENANVRNVSFHFGDALHLTDNSHLERLVNKCDIVHCHMVLQHLSNATQGLSQMRAMAREGGGLVAVRESDNAGCVIWPDFPELQRATQEYIELAQSKGADPLVGRKLIHLAIEVGFPFENIKGSVDGLMSFSSIAEKKSWIGMLQSGWKVMDETEDSAKKRAIFGAEEAKQAWSKWADMPGSWCFLPCCRIVARKE